MDRVKDVHQFRWHGRDVVVFFEAYQDRVYIDKNAYVHSSGDARGKAMNLEPILRDIGLEIWELEDRIHQDCFGESGAW